MDDALFLKLLRQRTTDVVEGRPRSACDLVHVRASTSDLAILSPG
jgi:hypothetical protein